MRLDFYLTHTGDKLLDDLEQVDDILKAPTFFGNTLYWNILSRELERIDWLNPLTKEINPILTEELDTMSKYYLRSYGEKFDVNGELH